MNEAGTPCIRPWRIDLSLHVLLHDLSRRLPLLCADNRKHAAELFSRHFLVRAKLTVISSAGKEATITLLSSGDFIGEEAIASVAGLRLASTTALTACAALKIADGSFDTICHLCFRTLGNAEKEEDLTALEQRHVCNKRDLDRIEHLTAQEVIH